MKWLAANWTTITMAIVLSLVTVGLLTTPGEEEPPVKLPAAFRPTIKAEVGSLEFSVDGEPFTDQVNVWVSGDLHQITVMRLTCSPLLDESKFPSDPAVRETTVEITAKDFNLPSDLANLIRIKPFTMKINYAPMMTKKIPIDATVLDIQDAQGSNFRVDSVSANPPAIEVRLPVDKAATIKALPIRPITIAGRVRSFETEGLINSGLPDMKDVRAKQAFTISVELSPNPYRQELEGVVLFLSHPPPPDPAMKAELVDTPMLRVILQGPEKVVKELKPEQIHAYVKVDWGPQTADGTYPFQIKLDLGDEMLRKQVRVELGPGMPRMAAVRIFRS